jgi:hypothetical protein
MNEALPPCVVECCPYGVAKCAVDCVCRQQPERLAELNRARRAAIREGNWGLKLDLERHGVDFTNDASSEPIVPRGQP